MQRRLPYETLRRITIGGLMISAFAGGNVLFTGCGANAPRETFVSVAPASTGRASVSVRWPEPSRLIPFASNSIKVTVIRDGALVGEKLLTRPANGGTTSTTFERVPLGTALVQAVALPNADGSGVAQAKAETTAAVVADQVVPIKLSLQSAISQIEIAPAVTKLTVGQAVALTATPRNEAGEIVLTTSSTLVWSSRTPDIATVTAGGQVAALGSGTATIEVRETESGKTAALSFPVEPISTPTPTPTPTPTANPADLIAYDGFDYEPNVIINGLSGGTGLTTPWGEYGSSSSRTVVNATGLTYEGLQVTGRAARTTSNRPIGNNRLVANAKTTLNANGNIIYFSLLIRPLVDPNSLYFGMAQGGIFVGKSGSQGDWVIENQGGANQVHTGIRATMDTTFLVYRISYRNGNEKVEFWVNPTVGQPLPTPSAVIEDREVGEPEMSYGGSDLCIFDEYRIGRTWESVAPKTP